MVKFQIVFSKCNITISPWLIINKLWTLTKTIGMSSHEFHVWSKLFSKNIWFDIFELSVIFNEFAIMDYFERRYLEAEEKFTYALQHNPKVSQYYISRARVRHLVDVSSDNC